jgi:hypothetical protein
MQYPMLVPGTLVKPQVRGLNFHSLRVVEDPGPVHHPRRIIELQRTEPQRTDQRVVRGPSCSQATQGPWRDRMISG